MSTMELMQASAWREVSNWMAEQELDPESGEELLALLAEAAPGLGLFANSSPSARRTGSRKRSVEVASRLRQRLKAAVSMPTGELAGGSLCSKACTTVSKSCTHGRTSKKRQLPGLK